MADPLVEIIMSLGTPAGIILVWWNLRNEIRSLSDRLNALESRLEKTAEKVEARHEHCSGVLHSQINDVSLRLARVEGN